jgi:hypothetical protein
VTSNNVIVIALKKYIQFIGQAKYKTTMRANKQIIWHGSG